MTEKRSCIIDPAVVSQLISVIPTVRWQSLCCTVLKMHRYIAETLSMSASESSERPIPQLPPWTKYGELEYERSEF